MMPEIKDGNTCFCKQCGRETEYLTREGKCRYANTEYLFPITQTFCKECGKEVFPEGIMKLTVNEFADWCRKEFGIEAPRCS